MATSEAQITANQANAQRSTGPVSAAGKAVSSQNATRHMIWIADPSTHTETQEEYFALANVLLEELRPATFLETNCVYEMATAHFRLQRARAQEADLYKADYAEWAKTAQEGDLYDRGAAFSRLCAKGDLPRNMRYQRQFERAWERTKKELMELQGQRRVAERKAERAQAAEDLKRIEAGIRGMFRERHDPNGTGPLTPPPTPLDHMLAAKQKK